MSEGNIILTHKSLCYYEGCLSHFHIYIFVVAVTVCGNSGWTSHDDYNLMKFPYIKTNIGINNVTSTGIFTCNSAGLYQITAVIFSRSSGGTMGIFENDVIMISSLYTAENSNYEQHTTTDVVMTELRVGDSIHMRRRSPIDIFARDSCLTC